MQLSVAGRMRVLAGALVIAVAAAGALAAYRLHQLSDELVRATSHVATLTRSVGEARVLARAVRAAADRETYGAPAEPEAPGRGGAPSPDGTLQRLAAALRAELAGLREMVQRRGGDAAVDFRAQAILIEQIRAAEANVDSYAQRTASALQKLQDGEAEDIGAVLGQIERDGKALSSRIDEIGEQVWSLTVGALRAGAAAPQEVASRIVELSAAAALAILLVAGLARRFVTRRLTAVVGSLEALAAAGQADPLLVSSGDEFGRAASAFNRIRGQILRANALYEADGAKAAAPLPQVQPAGGAAPEPCMAAPTPVAAALPSQPAADHAASAAGGMRAPAELEALASLVERIVSQSAPPSRPEPAGADRAAPAPVAAALMPDGTASLADRAAEATDALGAQLAGIQQVTRASVEAIQGISATVAQIKDLLATVAPADGPAGAVDPGKLRALRARG